MMPARSCLLELPVVFCSILFFVLHSPRRRLGFIIEIKEANEFLIHATLFKPWPWEAFFSCLTKFMTNVSPQGYILPNIDIFMT